MNWRKGETIHKREDASRVCQGIDMNTGKIIAIKTIYVIYHIILGSRRYG